MRKIINGSLALIITVMLVNCENSSIINSEQEKAPPKAEYVQLDSGPSMLIADDSKLPSEEQDYLEEISEQLAVAHVYDHNPEQVEIPGKVIDYFYNGLVHLYNSNLPEAVEITDNHHLIVTSPSSAREIILWIRDQKPWVENLKETGDSTGVPEIDELISRFHMSLVDYREYSIGEMEGSAKLRSDEPVNVFAAGELFTDLPHIEFAGTDLFTSGGRDVTATAHDDYLLMDVTVGWGDCMAGCINTLHRIFHISADGFVEVEE